MKDKRMFILYVIVAAIFLLPSGTCISLYVNTNHGQFTERLGAGIDDAVFGSTTISRDGLWNSIWATSTPKSNSDTTADLNFAETHSVGSNTNAGAEVGVQISNAKSYSYAYKLYPGTSWVGAAERLNVYVAKQANAWAKAYNKGLNDAGVSIQVNNGDLVGYSNLAIASTDTTGAYQMFDIARGTIKCDSTARNLASIYTPTVETNTIPEASIKTQATGTITNYEDASVKSSKGTSIEQNARVVGTFSSATIAKTNHVTRTSDTGTYGTKYDMDMQANILANGYSKVWSPLTYYIDPNLKIQGAVDKARTSEVINLAPGTYNENVNIQKAVTIRGDNVKVTSVQNNGGKVYLNSMKVLLRADDFYYTEPNWTWLTNLVNSKDISATYAVIPGLAVHEPYDGTNVFPYMQALDKNKFELATHGLNHDQSMPEYGDYTAQLSALTYATNIMTENLYRPRTFVAPYLATDANTLTALKALGYHTVVADPVSGATGITQLNADFTFEKDWYPLYPVIGPVTHNTFDEFKAAFDSAYTAGAKTYQISVHPDTFSKDPDYSDATASTTANRNELTKDVDYMKSQKNVYGSGVEFMTMEQYYKYTHR